MKKRVSYHLSAFCFSLKVSLHSHPVFSPSTYCKVALFLIASMTYLTEANKELASSAVLYINGEIAVLKRGALMGVSPRIGKIQPMDLQLSHWLFGTFLTSHRFHVLGLPGFSDAMYEEMKVKPILTLSSHYRFLSLGPTGGSDTKSK